MLVVVSVIPMSFRWLVWFAGLPLLLVLEAAGVELFAPHGMAAVALGSIPVWYAVAALIVAGGKRVRNSIP